MNPTVIQIAITIAVGLLAFGVGAALAWVVVSGRSAARVGQAESTIIEVRRQLEERIKEIVGIRETLEAEQKARTAA